MTGDGWLLMIPHNSYHNEPVLKWHYLKQKLMNVHSDLMRQVWQNYNCLYFKKKGKPQMVEIWGDRCEALTADKQAESWISDYLGKRCNFVFMPEHSNRQVDSDYAIGRNQVAFSDGFPLLLISEASLLDLNSRVPEEITMKRFRPNLVVKNTDPYQEDNWEAIRIGDCELQIVKPCSRCVLTTVDPENGEFSGREPLQTLAKYRKFNGKVVFGQNLIPLSSGKIEVGMKVQILK
ncbi:MAG: hypothetical protein CM1200mP30_08430 [Pseudomonadota bacterium]|nr:MAG: hypothetical protein CM1200mP30_08430 [Pseudomonadota bacterium]